MKFRQLFADKVKDKKVLVRVDFNVPIRNGIVTDDTRIRAHKDTLELLLDNAAKVVLLSHLGRPKGMPSEEFSIKQLVGKVEEIYEKKVLFCEECFGPKVTESLEALKSGDLLLLENVRFYSQEKNNDQEFAEKLASPFDVFIMDAFSASHRAHSSTNAIQKILPSYPGLLMAKEIEMLDAVSSEPQKPFVLILGGAKVSDKIGVIDNLMSKASAILIGGGMAYTFLRAQGHSIGRSLFEEDKVDFAFKMLEKAKETGVDIVLPVDTIVAEGPGALQGESVHIDSIPDNMMGLDIGRESVEIFRSYIENAKTILWNGPMGVFEENVFSMGTREIGQIVVKVTEGGALSVVGGGDTAAAVKKFGFTNRLSHVSTGGGASLEFCEGKILPGIDPLLDK